MPDVPATSPPDTAEEATRDPDRPDVLDLIGPDFDRLADTPARRTLIICSAPRTGSTDLCRFLIAAGIGIPHEYFNPYFATRLARRWGLKGNPLAEDKLGDYMAALRRRRVVGDLFAVKLQNNQFFDYLRNSHGAALYERAFVVHLFRPDAAAQFVSFSAARDTGVWDYSGRRTMEPRSFQSQERFERTVRELEHLALEDFGFRRLFILLGIHPMFITTEELFARPRLIVEAIAAAVNLPVKSEPLERAIAAATPYRRETTERRDDELAQTLRRHAFRK